MEKNYQKQAAEAANQSVRKVMANQYGMWYNEDATASELVSWCDGRIAKYNEWIKNCKALKEASQLELLAGVPREALLAALEALNAPAEEAVA